MIREHRGRIRSPGKLIRPIYNLMDAAIIVLKVNILHPHLLIQPWMQNSSLFDCRDRKCLQMHMAQAQHSLRGLFAYWKQSFLHHMRTSDQRHKAQRNIGKKGKKPLHLGVIVQASSRLLSLFWWGICGRMFFFPPPRLAVFGTDRISIVVRILFKSTEKDSF